MSDRHPLILLTNDDGYLAEGLNHLMMALLKISEVVVVAPDRPRSSISNAVTLHKPLRVECIRAGEGYIVYSCNGTPADCVALGVRVLCPRTPNLVISGINDGENVGDDVIYSGTVAAAMEGAVHGITSFAISIATLNSTSKQFHYETACEVAVRLSQYLLREQLPMDSLLNVNVPNLPLSEIKGVAITSRGRKRYVGDLEMRYDPQGRPYYWRGSERPVIENVDGTDVSAIVNGYISITPLQTDNTNFRLLPILAERFKNLLQSSL
ncbi:MAG: 5'/3'-nucleotidase SurE [Armatimonadota bacterium]|nr:5'/3'-nucleotidase SurE [Armatimonadota bacterium]MCX7778003.1 5'/3'-nucleotidase SurE [Armatimonadota bacterium]MDW8026022.1 5'/3'-nucleotidase SurE [Armatimonadota bacterium]